jgi:hypothetical protein
MEAKLEEEFTGDEDRHFLLSLLSQVKKVPDALKLQMRTEMMQVVTKFSQPIPPSHFIQPHYFHQRPDPNMPRIGETQKSYGDDQCFPAYPQLISSILFSTVSYFQRHL